jgi:hypothetical protein
MQSFLQLLKTHPLQLRGALGDGDGLLCAGDIEPKSIYEDDPNGNTETRLWMLSQSSTLSQGQEAVVRINRGN